MLRTLSLAAILVGTAGGAWAATADFDDLVLAPESYWNGSADPAAGGFQSGGAWFGNQYVIDPTYPYWYGWSYSRTSDTTTNSYTNQFSAIPGVAHSGSNYAVAWDSQAAGWTYSAPTITLPAPTRLVSACFTNTTYAYLTMSNGDPYGYGWAKQFGGDDGTDPDWLRLTITGKDAAGQPTGSVLFYLADYRSPVSAEDYLVNTWTPVDLSPLGVVKTVEFALTGTDGNAFGLFTPAYFAMDTLVLAPEPATLGLVAAGLAAAALRRR